MSKKASSFSKNLIAWYLENKRDLPWRHSKDPYVIWLSEIILQQTRVAQGLPYFLKFTAAFPTVQDLAAATEEDVLKLWQGLGYYSRARNLHKAAKKVVLDYNGVFPATYNELLKLSGVGDYTASAIASFCNNEPTAVVDGNVYRVLSRVYGIDTPINSTQGIKQFKALAQQLLDKEQAGTNNQAIMEFGAQYCVPQNPPCLFCIFKETCVAYQTGKVAALPVKLKKTKVTTRHFHYIVLQTQDRKTRIEQRQGKGIWQNLYQFPLIEGELKLTPQALKDTPYFKEVLAPLHISTITLQNKKPVIHKLSHQHLYTHFWKVSIQGTVADTIPISALKSYPFPVLISNYINESLLPSLNISIED